MVVSETRRVRIAVLFSVLALSAAICFGQSKGVTANPKSSIAQGVLTKNSYLNDDLGLELKFPEASTARIPEDGFGAAKAVADSLNTGKTKNDSRLEIQASSTLVLFTVFPPNSSTFLSIAVAKQQPNSTRDMVESTIELLSKSGQYKQSTEISTLRVSNVPMTYFTVKKVGSNPETFWRLFSFRKNGFDVTVGLVYSSDEELDKLEKILNSIRVTEK